MAWQNRGGEKANTCPEMKAQLGHRSWRPPFTFLRGGWGLDKHPLWTALNPFGPLAIVKVSYWFGWKSLFEFFRIILQKTWMNFLANPIFAATGNERWVEATCPLSITSCRWSIKRGQGQNLPNAQTFIGKQAPKAPQPASRDFGSWPGFVLTCLSHKGLDHLSDYLHISKATHLTSERLFLASLKHIQPACVAFSSIWSVYVTVL